MHVQDKVVVVTGGGSGVGRALVVELLARGARVAALDISAKGLQETVAQAGDRAASLATFEVNITDRAQVEASTQQILSRFGAADGLINCAGIIQPFVPLAQLDYPTIDRVFDVNFRGTLYMTKVWLPLLLARPEGHVVNVSSMGGFMPVPGQTIYGASKAAVKLLTEGLHSELAGTTVRVTIVFPGAVATNIMHNSGLAERAGSEAERRRITQPDDAARQIINGMERDAFRVLVGSDAKIIDLLYRLNPARATKFIGQKLKSLIEGPKA